MKKKKISLKNLNVKSFTTDIDKAKQLKLKGGATLGCSEWQTCQPCNNLGADLNRELG